MLLLLDRFARKSQFVARGEKPFGGQTASLKPRRRWGATTVEMAVVAPVVFLIILGIIEAARGIMVVHLLNNAAQAGCRTGIIEGKSTAAIQTVVFNEPTTA